MSRHVRSTIATYDYGNATSARSTAMLQQPAVTNNVVPIVLANMTPGSAEWQRIQPGLTVVPAISEGTRRGTRAAVCVIGS